jgi:hypothetical protein
MTISNEQDWAKLGIDVRTIKVLNRALDRYYPSTEIISVEQWRRFEMIKEIISWIVKEYQSTNDEQLA